VTDESGSRTKYAPIVLTGLVSLVVGVASGWLIDVLTSPKLALKYELSPVTIFEGRDEKVGIVNLRVVNGGTKEIEAVSCLLSLAGAKVREARAQGLPEDAIETSSESESLTVKLPFLNPGESFSVQLFLGVASSPTTTPSIQLRGKGVVGEEVDRDAVGSDEKPILATFASAMAALLSVLVAFVLRRKQLVSEPSLTQQQQQRDVFAFALELNGFDPQAKVLRRMDGDQSYWSLSDALYAAASSEGDADAVRRGTKALQHVIQLAGEHIASGSLAIINLNIARLAVRLDDAGLAREAVAKALESKDPAVQGRVDLLDELRPFLRE